MMGMRHILVLLVVGSSGTNACYEEFNEMFWTEDQCEDAFAVTNPMDAGQDVQDCVALCTMQSTCTSLNYWVKDGGKNCALLNCNATKPEGFQDILAFKKNDEGEFPGCKFPFIYEGVSYSTCTEADHDRPWCSTETDDNDKHNGTWKNCDGYDELNLKGWSNAQCGTPDTTPMNASQDMQDCVALCTKQSNCTRVNYYADENVKDCTLFFNCDATIPEITASKFYPGILAFKKLGTGIEPVCKPTNICKKRGGTCMANYCPCDGFIVSRGCIGGKNCKCCAPTRPIRCHTNRRCRNSGGKCKPITELEACNGMNGTMINHKCQGKRCGCCIPN